MARLPGPSGSPGQWVKVEEGSPNQAYPLTEHSPGGNPSPLSILNSLLGPYVLQNYTLTSGTVAITVSPQAATFSRVTLGGGGEASPLLILNSLFGDTGGIIAGTVALTVSVQAATLRSSRFVAGGTVALTVSPQAATLTKGGLPQGGDPAPLLILSSLLQANSANKFLACNTVAVTVTPRAATLAPGKRFACDTVSFVVSIAPGQVDTQLTAETLPIAVSVKAAGVYRSTILPLVASPLAYAVTIRDAQLVKQGNDKILAAFPVDPIVVTVQQATSLRDYVLYADSVALTATIQAAFMPGETIPEELRARKLGRAKRRNERKYVVEIDGEEFIVESVEQAQNLLEQAKETYREVIQKVKAAPIDNKVRMPSIRVEGPQGQKLDAMVETVKSARNDIGELYELAKREVEKALVDALAAREKAQQEDEEILLLL